MKGFDRPGLDSLKVFGELKSFGSIGFLDSLYDERIGFREKISDSDWLNELMLNRIRELGHHKTMAYEFINEDLFTAEQMACFLSEYYWGSGYGFQREVLKEAYKSANSNSFKEYLADIIREEQKPKQHYQIFKEFMSEINIAVVDRRDDSKYFVDQQIKGYTSDTCYAFGYALGIEMDADYQISLICLYAIKYWEDSVYKNDFFEVHVDPTGELMHAKHTCSAILKIVESETDAERVKEGFDQAIRNTGDFLSTIVKNSIKIERAA